MTQSQIKNIFFALISSIFFLLDLMLFAIMQQHQIYLLLSFFIVFIIQSSQHRTVVAPLFLLSLLSYLDINIFGWCLVYILPTILFAHYLNQNLRMKYIISYILLFTALLLKLFLDSSIHRMTISSIYVIQVMAYNLILVLLLKIIQSYYNIKSSK